MKPATRDNLIYLAVGLSIAALVTADFFYADTQGWKMWLPSRFAFRAVYTTALIWYVVLKGVREANRTLVQVSTRVLFATLLHLTIVIASRQIIEQLAGVVFCVLWVLEMYLVVVVTAAAAPGSNAGASTGTNAERRRRLSQNEPMEVR